MGGAREEGGRGHEEPEEGERRIGGGCHGRQARTPGLKPDGTSFGRRFKCCPKARMSPVVEGGEEFEVRVDSGVVTKVPGGNSLKAEALPPNIQHILKQGGLVEVTKAKLAAASPAPT